MSDISNYFSTLLNNTYVTCIETGGGPLDFVTSFNYQVRKGCEKIKNDPNFQGDFSVVGISQGALHARHIIEKCDMKGRVKRYVSIGGPQMGVGSIPQCTGGIFCQVVNKVAGSLVYYSIIQMIVGPAGYFKDVSQYDTYLGYSSFLSDLNNEKPEKNESYKERFSALEKTVLIKFSEDTMIIPKETAWFQFYNDKMEVAELKDQEFYKSDFLGVKKLNEEGKISFVELQGNHLQFSDYDIVEYMIPALS